MPKATICLPSPCSSTWPKWPLSSNLICVLGRPSLILGVWSRDEVVRVDLEGCRVLCPGLADRLERGSPLEPLEVLGEVVGRDKGQDMSLQALQIRIVEH